MFLPRYNMLSPFIRRHYRSLIGFLNIYKAFNVLLALSEMKIRRTTCISRPFIFRIEPCSVCNLRCVSCNSYKAKTNEKRIMDFNNFKTIVNKVAKYALRTALYDLGEPLLNKDIYKMIRYASDSGLSTLISTNFNLFHEDDIDALFDSRLTVLEPCLDGFTQKSYEKYRRGGDVEIVKKGIELVMEHKAKRKVKWPVVDVQVILFDHIKEEIPIIDNFLKQCNVDKITYRQENLGFNSPQTSIAQNQVTSESSCFWLYIGMLVRPDGSVYPCCGRGFDRFSYGNLLKQDLSEIWNNKYYQFSRSLFSKGQDLDYDEEMLNIPCLACILSKKHRAVAKKIE